MDTLRRRLEDLHVLRETLVRNACFDAEDVAWVDEEIAAVQARLTPVVQAPPGPAVPPSYAAVRRREAVLMSLNGTMDVLSRSALGRRLAEKQHRLQQLAAGGGSRQGAPGAPRPAAP